MGRTTRGHSTLRSALDGAAACPRARGHESTQFIVMVSAQTLRALGKDVEAEAVQLDLQAALIDLEAQRTRRQQRAAMKAPRSFVSIAAACAWAHVHTHRRPTHAQWPFCRGTRHRLN